MNIDIQVDSNKLLNQLSALQEDLKISMKNLLNDTANTVLDTAKETCPVDTGKLKASLQVQLAGTADDTVHVGTDVNYAVYVHEGARGRQGVPFLLNGYQAGLRYMQVHGDTYLEKAVQP